METSAVTVMVIGMVVIWGGFAASVLNAVRRSRAARREAARGDSRDG